MAIRFFPTNEDTDAQYEILNRLLLELCELLRVMMVTRGSENAAVNACIPNNIQLPDLLMMDSNIRQQFPRRRVMSSQTPPASPSCSYQHLSRTFSEVFDTEPAQSMAYFGDDEVFCSSNNGSLSTLPMANMPLSRPLPLRQRRRRRRTNSLRDSKKKNARSKSDDADEIANLKRDVTDNDTSNVADDNTVESPTVPVVLEKEAEPETSMISTFLSTKLGGSIWTAVVIVLGWKLLATTR